MVERASQDKTVEQHVLTLLSENEHIEDTLALATELGISHVELDKTLKSLLVEEYVSLQVIERKLLELTDEGALYAEKGTPEF